MTGTTNPGRWRHPRSTRESGLRRISLLTRGAAVGGLSVGVGVGALLAVQAPHHATGSSGSTRTAGDGQNAAPAAGSGSASSGQQTGAGSSGAGRTAARNPAAVTPQRTTTRHAPKAQRTHRKVRPPAAPPAQPPPAAQNPPVVSGGS